MLSNTWLSYFFFVISVIFLLIGLLVHSGRFKGWWLNVSTPITPVGIFYALLPSSLFFFIFRVLIALPISPEKRGDIALYILTPVMFIILIIATWQPQWLKPKWLRWLESNHKEIKPLLWDDARSRGKLEWQKLVRTQDGLEEWVEEVRNKYKFDHSDQRFIGDPHA